MNIFDVNIVITGDCTNSNAGAAFLTAIPNPDTTFPFGYLWYNPYLGTGQTQTNLSAGTYLVEVNDSSTPNNISLVNVTISSGVCASIISEVDTTCGENNGSLTLSADTSSPFSNTFYLYSGATLVNSQFATSETFTFTSLSPGIYYGVIRDVGGCTGITESCIVHDSNQLTYGAYIVPATNCFGSSGKIYITGQTGNEPFIYEWIDSDGPMIGQTGSTLTGLTEGLYTVTVTSSDNCILTTTYEVPLTSPLGAFVINTTNPSCFSSDGEIEIQITGGTSPFFFSGSNGTSEITYSTTYNFSGLTSGPFTVSVTDVGLCNVLLSTNLITPNTFIIESIISEDSVCGLSDGKITINLLNGSGPYTYQLYSTSGTSRVLSNSTNQIFSDLASGTYTLTISASSTTCVYSQEIVISSIPLFSITSNVTGSTCSQNNGQVEVVISTGATGPFLYEIVGPTTLSTLDVDYEHIFTDLQSGIYDVNVTSSNGCTINSEFYIEENPPLNFTLFGTDCGLGSGGTITAIITSGLAPFTLDWVPDVSNGIFATGLTPGNYSLTIVDSNGCSDIQSIEITCNAVYGGYRTFNICTDIMELNYGNKFGLIEMLNYGFQDFTSGDTTCVLNSAEFIVSVTANSVTLSGSVYTGISLIDVPSDEQMYSTVETLLESISGIGNVDIDYDSNLITVSSDCTLNNLLANINVKIELIIIYDVSCDDL